MPTNSFLVRTLIFHRLQHDTHPDTQKKQIVATFRGVATMMLKKISNSSFCSHLSGILQFFGVY